MSKRYPEIKTVALTSKDIAYSITLPAHTKSYLLKTRSNCEFKVSYKSGVLGAGGSQDDYLTIPSSAAEIEDGLSREDATIIYVQSEKDNDTLECKIWA